MVEVKDFSKVYKLSKKQMKKMKNDSDEMMAVKGISFTAKEGEIFGLLGPNGAGKTTTLRSIVTLLKPTKGQITVQGQDVEIAPTKVREKIGFLTNELKLDKHFTPAYTMEFFGQLHQMPMDRIEARKKQLFEYFGITEFANKKIGELSTGMGQKLSIAVSLIHDPEVIIFDEPTNGLDIITAKAVTKYLQFLKEQGKVVIISTHIMTVAEKLCDKVAIIIKGEKVIEGTVDELIAQTGKETLEEVFFDIYEQIEGR